MRKLSPSFINSLKSGFLKGLREKVNEDTDLDLEIRENYLNIYYKGNSLLKLDELSDGRYRPTVHKKFLDGRQLSVLENVETVKTFLDLIPEIKDNIIKHGKSSIETEYEQMIIRANNYEPRNNSEYFIIDRQYTAGSLGRFDLTGFCWPRAGRRKYQEVPICLIEIKYALNKDIQTIDKQVSRYYEAINMDVCKFAEEAESIFKQKLELGLFIHPDYRLKAMETLTFSRNIKRFQFIIILVDYNPHSKLLDLNKLTGLTFCEQIRIINTGFGLWENNLITINKKMDIANLIHT